MTFDASQQTSLPHPVDGSGRLPPPQSRRFSFSNLNWINFILPIAGIVIVVVSVLVWRKFPAGKTFGSLTDSHDLFERMMDAAIDQSAFEFALWSKANIIIQSVLILGALLATVFASLTTSANADSMKKWSVFLTALTASFASVQSVFHIRENIETFIASASKLENIESQYIADREALRAQKSVDQRVGNSKIDSAQLYSLYKKYSMQMSEVTAAEARAWANVGQQSLIENINNPPPAPIQVSPPTPLDKKVETTTE